MSASKGERKEVIDGMKTRLIYIAVVAAMLAAFLAEFADPFGVADGHL